MQKDYFVGIPIGVTDHPKLVSKFKDLSQTVFRYLTWALKVSRQSNTSPKNLASSATLMVVPSGLMSGSAKTPLWLVKWTHSVLLTEKIKPFSWTHLFTPLTHNWSRLMTLSNDLPFKQRAKYATNKEDSRVFQNGCNNIINFNIEQYRRQYATLRNPVLFMKVWESRAYFYLK